MSVATAEYVKPHGGGVAALVGVHLRIMRRFMTGVIFQNTLSPLLYLWSLGIGLGSLVNHNHPDTIGVSYLAYVAPGLIAATALQIAAAECMFPIMVGFQWVKRYFAMNATPLNGFQICAGQLWLTVLELLFNSTIYLALVWLFGGVRSIGALLIIPIAVLGAMAFASLVAAYTATIDHESTFFNIVIRFMVMPMFLFSGIFYPLASMPAWGRLIAYVSPLWHTTELARAAALGSLHLKSGAGQLSAGAVLGHLMYLLVLCTIGVALTVRNFSKRLSS